jgi:hypothetical protein
MDQSSSEVFAHAAEVAFVTRLYCRLYISIGALRPSEAKSNAHLARHRVDELDLHLTVFWPAAAFTTCDSCLMHKNYHANGSFVSRSSGNSGRSRPTEIHRATSENRVKEPTQTRLA